MNAPAWLRDLPPWLRIAAFLVVAAIAATVPAFPGADGGRKAGPEFPGWPAEFEGKPIRETRMNAMERRFYGDMPGRVARFTDGRRQIVVRWLGTPDQKFHLSARCFKGSGYEVRPLPNIRDAGGRSWGVFEARKERETLRVRERIEDSAGHGWTDEQTHRWDMFWRRTDGPWWGFSVVEPE